LRASFWAVRQRRQVRIVCNDFGNNVPYSAYHEASSQIRDRLPDRGAESRTTRQHLADRSGTRFSAPRTRCGPGATTVGVSAGAAQGSDRYQFPFRGAPVPERALSDHGIALLRVHGQQAAEIEV
jgi:hypothetical protein